MKNPYTGILSIFSTLMLENKSINIFEDGLESRDFINVVDIVYTPPELYADSDCICMTVSDGTAYLSV